MQSFFISLIISVIIVHLLCVDKRKKFLYFVNDPLFSFESEIFMIFMASSLVIYQKQVLQSFPLTETIATLLKLVAFYIK